MYRRIGDSYRKTEVVELKAVVVHPAYTHRAQELVVLDHARHELISYPYRIPAGCGIVILDKSLYLIAGEMTPTSFRLGYLLVTYIVFVFTLGKERRIYPSVHMFDGRNYGNFFHNQSV